ncbi:MAG TPA: polysaccharide deacetylase family protein [Candidatus Acidoferrales bacterium]|nr:polysaccharide deacetylase family protein [Candidatus Acidoferrales bacterium]
MRRRLVATTLALALGANAMAAGAPVPAPPGASPGKPAFPLIAILCYHDLSTDSGAPLEAVPPEFLREQIRACKADGWTFLSLGELLARREHPELLPRRVMVLTFDDGYRSFEQRALPILRAEGVRSTQAIITSFVEQPHPDLPPLLDWSEIRRIAQSGDVEIASHTHGLHVYETDNPYGDTGPSVGTRRYLAAERRYEDREEYRSRVGDDLLESQRVLRQHLGRPATTLVWPYGIHNEMARGLAAHAGFAVTLALGGRAVTAEDLRSGCLPRVMVTRAMSFRGGDLAWLEPPPAPIRAVGIDLDALWDPDESAFRARLDQAVMRARALGATHAILPVCPDPRSDGRLLRAYAMNHQLPVLADVWSMAAAKCAAAGLRVWLRAPALNLTWAWDDHPGWRLRGSDRDGARWGTRLSPDLPQARQAAMDFFTDLAVYLPIDGVLFDDDAAVYRDEKLAGDSTAGAHSTLAAKQAALRGWLDACEQAVRAWRPECRFARVVPAEVVERDGPDERFAQDFSDDLASGELSVVTLPAGRRGRAPSAHDAGRLARRAVSRWRAGAGAGTAAPPPVLLLVPAYDLEAHRWIPAQAEQAMATAALHEGIADLGLSPVAAEGDLPLGMLDPRTPAPAVRDASRRN